MTLPDKLAQIDQALATRNFSECYALVQEYRGMVAECVNNMHPGPNHVDDVEVYDDMP